MLSMVSYSRRPQSGQFTCYLNRTDHVLPTRALDRVDKTEILDNIAIATCAIFQTIIATLEA
jgi:hypothetical protein